MEIELFRKEGEKEEMVRRVLGTSKRETPKLHLPPPLPEIHHKLSYAGSLQ